MRALLQRVSSARVDVEGDTVGAIGPGLLVLLGLDKGDDEDAAAQQHHAKLQPPDGPDAPRSDG